MKLCYVLVTMLLELFFFMLGVIALALMCYNGDVTNSRAQIYFLSLNYVYEGNQDRVNKED